MYGFLLNAAVRKEKKKEQNIVELLDIARKKIGVCRGDCCPSFSEAIKKRCPCCSESAAGLCLQCSSRAGIMECPELERTWGITACNSWFHTGPPSPQNVKILYCLFGLNA